jgi:hypothetical protein
VFKTLTSPQQGQFYRRSYVVQFDLTLRLQAPTRHSSKQSHGGNRWVYSLEFYIFGIMVTAYKHNDNTKGVNVRCTTGAGYCIWVAYVFPQVYGVYFTCPASSSSSSCSPEAFEASSPATWNFKPSDTRSIRECNQGTWRAWRCAHRIVKRIMDTHLFKYTLCKLF